MGRLIEGLGKNSAQEYNRIFQERKERGVDIQDLRRWKKLLKYYRGGKLIDLGCLDSLIPKIARELHPVDEIWGIDIAEDAIKAMQEEYPEVIYEFGDVYDTRKPSNYFDYAVAGELLEHLEYPEKCVEETMRILKHGGIFAISTPREEENEPGAVDAERHVWSFSEKELKKMLEPYGKVWFRTIRSQYFPTYQYCWPTLLTFVKKA